MVELKYTDLKYGELELIKYLHLKNIPNAVATSTYAKLSKKLLLETKSLHYFDLVVTGDMVENGKLSPEILLTAFKRLDVEPKKTIILEDSANGIRAALASVAKHILI